MPDTIGRVAYALNLCQCGHDFALHTNPANLQTGSCNGCAPGNIHAFCSDKEIYPSTEFPESQPSGFFVTPGSPAGPTTTINHVGGYPVNTTSMVLTSNAGIVAGMVAFFNPGVAARQSRCTVVNVLAGNTIVLLNPGLQVAVNQGDTVIFVWADGSTPGPARSANGQRGG